MNPTFGKPMAHHFLFEDGWTNMNHGSFGAVPRLVRKSLRRRQQILEAAPDRFIRFDYHRELTASRQRVAELVNAPPDTIVLVPNATTGLDTILRNLEYGPSDHMIMFSTVYGTCERTAFHLAETTGVQVTRIPLEYPISDAELVHRFRQTVLEIQARGHRAMVAIFDVISFQPGVRVPFEALVAECRQLGVLSCVDGAHCIGQLPIDLAALDADFFVSNLHKWLFVPRGCAVLYTPVRNQGRLRTTFPTSWGFTPKHAMCNTYFTRTTGWQRPFEVLFESFGTMDYSPFLTIRDSLAFRESLGGEAVIMRYNNDLAREGGAAMARILGTRVLDNEEGSLTRGCHMVNVLLPLEDVHTETLESVARALVDDHRAYVPIFEHGGRAWARVSAQIYLDLDSFRFLGRALLDLCQRASVRHGSRCVEHHGMGS